MKGLPDGWLGKATIAHIGPTAAESLGNLTNLSGERVRGEPTDGQTRKYGNRKVTLDGYTFASKKEARRYNTLKTMQEAGEIADLEVHPSYSLLGRDGTEVYGYTADFSYLSFVGVRTVEDCKSVATRKKDTWRIVKKLFRSTFGFDITEV